MSITPRQLNRATLARQLLLNRQSVGVTDGVRRVVALQAQEPASPYIALWNRLDGFEPSELDNAFAEAALVKASLMRITLHAVTNDDYPAFHAAMTSSLRAARLNARRFRSMDVTIDEVDALVPDVVEFLAEPRSKPEVEAFLDARVGPQPAPGLWWALRTFAPVAHAPTGEPWSFNAKLAYRAAPTAAKRVSATDGVQHLIQRYLEGFGPASAVDIGQFSILPMSMVRPALAAMEERLVQFEGPDGKPLYDTPGAALPSEDTAAPARLLAMWDSILLAYADRSRVIPEQYRSVVIRRNGNVLPTVLVDGYVRGVWRPLEGAVEVTPFEPFSRQTWKQLEAEAASLVEFVAARDPRTYGRYSGWWADMPADEARVIG